MPIYECKCDRCAHNFEEFAKMAEAGSIRCPKCNRVATRVPSLPYRERYFVGETVVSQMHGCKPEQVKKMRKLFPMVQWRDDGSIIYDKRSDETNYRKAKMDYIRKLHADVREHNQRLDERRARGLPD